MNMLRSFTIQILMPVLVGFFLALSLSSGCKRTPPETPSLTEEVKTAIQAEDQAVFEQEKALK